MTRALACFALIMLSACMKAPDPSVGVPQTTTKEVSGPPQLVFEAPADWTETPPSQSFFLKTWALPDGGIANFTWLGESTEIIASNVDRWIGQFQVEGGDPFAVAERGSLEGASYGTQTVRVAGTLVSVNQLGGGEPRQDWMLYGAVILSPSGPLYFKVLGPQAQLDEQIAQIEAALKTLSAEA